MLAVLWLLPSLALAGEPTSKDAPRLHAEVASVDVDGWVSDNARLAALQADGWTLVEQGGLPANYSGGGGLLTLPAGQDALALVDAPGGGVEFSWHLAGVGEETWTLVVPLMAPDSAERQRATTLHLDRAAHATFLARAKDTGPVFWALLTREGRREDTTLSSLMEPGAPAAPEPTAPVRDQRP